MRKIYIPKSRRVIKRFLFFRTLIGKEMRWLEKAEIEQKMIFNGKKWVWVNAQWLN